MCLFILQVSISDHMHMKRIQAKAGNERKKDQVSVRVLGHRFWLGLMLGTLPGCRDH